MSQEFIVIASQVSIVASLTPVILIYSVVIGWQVLSFVSNKLHELYRIIIKLVGAYYAGLASGDSSVPSKNNVIGV